MQAVSDAIEQRITELLRPNTGVAVPRRCDLLLFVAVRSEQEAVLRYALELGGNVTKVHGRESEYFDLGRIGTRSVMIVRTAEGPFSHAGSASKAIHCLTETQAAGLISVGMAFGAMPREQNVGDILVSTGILPYDEAHVRMTPTTSSFHDYSVVRRFPASEILLDEFRASTAMPEWKGKVHIGLMLSGAAKIYCSEFRDRLARKCEHGRGDLVVGGEMEGVGIASASPQDSPNWIIVKGICDFADHERNSIIKANRVVACRSAAHYVLDTLSRKVTI